MHGQHSLQSLDDEFAQARGLEHSNLGAKGGELIGEHVRVDERQVRSVAIERAAAAKPQSFARDLDDEVQS